jgi:hypothetical protein
MISGFGWGAIVFWLAAAVGIGIPMYQRGQVGSDLVMTGIGWPSSAIGAFPTSVIAASPGCRRGAGSFGLGRAASDVKTFTLLLICSLL